MPGLFPVRVWFPLSGSSVTTDSDGMVHYSNVRSDLKVRFQKEGYQEVLVDRIWPTIEMRQLPRDEPIGEEVIDGAILVPIKRRTTAHAAHAR